MMERASSLLKPPTLITSSGFNCSFAVGLWRSFKASMTRGSMFLYGFQRGVLLGSTCLASATWTEKSGAGVDGAFDWDVAARITPPLGRDLAPERWSIKCLIMVRSNEWIGFTSALR